MIANILGLGWAATPAGLKAMEELSKLEEQRRKHLAPGISRPAGTASNEMCTFLIITFHLFSLFRSMLLLIGVSMEALTLLLLSEPVLYHPDQYRHCCHLL